MSLIWYTSSDGNNWTLMKSPSTHKIDWEDLDSDSYRSVVNGNLIRQVIKRRWAKVGLSWLYLKDNDVNTICSAVNKDTVYFKFYSPAFGTNNYISFKGYVSKMSTEELQGKIGWNLSFNVVQSEVATWQ